MASSGNVTGRKSRNAGAKVKPSGDKEVNSKEDCRKGDWRDEKGEDRHEADQEGLFTEDSNAVFLRSIILVQH